MNMLIQVMLWFILGVGTSIVVQTLFMRRGQVAPDRRLLLISMGGALIGGMIMLIAWPAASIWALLTAAMGSFIAIVAVEIAEWAKGQPQ